MSECKHFWHLGPNTQCSKCGKVITLDEYKDATIAALREEVEGLRDRLLTVSADRNKHVEQSDCYRTRLAAAEEELAELKAWKRAYDESVKAALRG